MRDLAVVAEVSTATLYNLYQSKDMLILAALEDLLRGLNDRVDQSRVKGFECVVMRLQTIADQVVERHDTPKRWPGCCLLLRRLIRLSAC